MSEQEAIKLAVEALREQANKFHFDERAAKMLGDRIPNEVRRGVARRAELLEAAKVLQGLPSLLQEG